MAGFLFARFGFVFRLRVSFACLGCGMGCVHWERALVVCVGGAALAARVGGVYSGAGLAPHQGVTLLQTKYDVRIIRI